VEVAVPTTRLRAAADITSRAVAVLTVAGLAGLAGTISYRHMLLLAQRHGQQGIDAHAFPLCVDGLDLIGVLVLLADRRTGRASGWLPWTVLAVGTVASVAANVAVAPNNLVARAISGWSAVALLAAAKMLAHLFEPVAATRHLPATSTPFPAGDATASHHVAPHDIGASSMAPRDEDAGAVRGRQRRRIPADAARRVPVTPAARARWHAIWHATRHLPAATRDVAHAHGVSLRTLQFIRAAGEAGHLAAPPTPATDANTSPEPAAGSIPRKQSAVPADLATSTNVRNGAVAT
jgi:hypothetical protein